MLHLLNEAGGLWAPEQAAHIAQTGAETDAAHAYAAAEAVGALHKLVSVLRALAAERAPLAGTPAHVAGGHP